MSLYAQFKVLNNVKIYIKISQISEKINTTVVYNILNVLNFFMFGAEFRHLTKKTLNNHRNVMQTSRSILPYNPATPQITVRELSTVKLKPEFSLEDFQNLASPELIELYFASINEGIEHPLIINNSGEYSLGYATSQPLENDRSIPINNEIKNIVPRLGRLPSDFHTFFEKDKILKYPEQTLVSNLRKFSDKQLELKKLINLQEERINAIDKSNSKNQYKKNVDKQIEQKKLEHYIKIHQELDQVILTEIEKVTKIWEKLKINN